MNFDYKITVDNESNTAASLLNFDGFSPNIPFKVTSDICLDNISGVTSRSNTVINQSNQNLRLSRISSVFLDGIAPDFHTKDVLIHICHFTWQGEAQWVSRTPYELGIYPVAEHEISHIDQSISSVGSWSTHRYYPILIIEDRTERKTWFFELEAGFGWSLELGSHNKNGQCSLTLDCTACNENHDGFYRILAPNESFQTPCVLYGTTDGGFDDAVTSLLIFKRSHSRRFKTSPVCFNDYMNCLWATPTSDKLLSLIDAAAEAGAEIFCIDDGWFYRDCSSGGFGDWIENDSLFGNGGLKGIFAAIISKGMKPGLWFELETAFHDAAVTRLAPDALLTRNGIPIGSERRFLNFRCREVTEYLYGRIKHFYNLGVRYIKNDYNHSTGIGCDGENCSFSAALAEHTKAFYAFIERLYTDMPDLIIENCGSGAMRCDNGTLQHFHLQSTSDQEIFTNNPSIIRGMQCCILPEKSGIWSYPFPTRYRSRLDPESVYTEEYLKSMSDGEETVFNMCCAFFGIMTLSGRIDKCDSYNLELIKKAVDIYKSDRGFISESLPVFLGEQQKLYSEGYSVLALKNGRKMRIGVFRNGGDDHAVFDLPEDFANGKLRELYPLTSPCAASLIDGKLFFKTDKKLCARLYEIVL